jgi:hypothetical protein
MTHLHCHSDDLAKTDSSIHTPQTAATAAARAAACRCICLHQQRPLHPQAPIGGEGEQVRRREIECGCHRHLPNPLGTENQTAVGWDLTPGRAAALKPACLLRRERRRQKCDRGALACHTWRRLGSHRESEVGGEACGAAVIGGEGLGPQRSIPGATADAGGCVEQRGRGCALCNPGCQLSHQWVVH